MKFILYILLFCLLLSISCEEALTDKYDILQYNKLNTEDIEVIDGRNTFSAVKFKESKLVSRPIKNISLSETTISSPFIIYAVFSIDNSSCLFSIVDKGVVKLQLCFTKVDAVTQSIELKRNDAVVLNVQNSGGFFDNWVEFLLHIEDDKITMYTACGDSEVIDYTAEEIYFSNDAVVFYGSNDASGSFKGGIETIKIYTNSRDTPSLIMNCVPIFSSSTDEEELEPIAERLTSLPGGFDLGRGEKGDKGDRGESITGPEGPRGPKGDTGAKGDTGTCSCSESVVSNLLKSMPEMKGPKGDQGPKGEMGDIGDTGKQGKQGDKGEMGPRGPRGDTGVRGEDGASGKDGRDGLKGEPGLKGDTGAPGLRGPVGLPGPPGEAYKETNKTKEVPVRGDKGDMGPPGPIGLTGKGGEKGEKGQQGLKGEKGDKGHHGLIGPRGETGDRGETGPRGPAGEPGSHGRPGMDGKKGERGDKGSPGFAGLPASLDSLLDEKNAAIVEKIRGHRGETGHKGDKGDKGDAGPIGPSGMPGKDGRHGTHGKEGPKGDIGPKGAKGNQGEPGPPGNVPLSEIALMKGPKGDIGNSGPPGKDGAVGPRGPEGKIGANGPAGPKGPKGDTGAMGPRGPPGTTGLTGAKGEKGESGIASIDTKKLKGDKGDRGNDGIPGKDGAPGKCTDSCKPLVTLGPPGPPGAPGPPGSSVIGPKGEPGGIISEKTFYSIDGTHNHGPALDDDDDFYSPTTVVFRTVTALIKHTQSTPLGTLAYVLYEKTLLLRVENGWQYIVLGSLMDARITTTTYKPPSPQYHVLEGAPTKRSSIGAYIRLIALNEPHAGKITDSHGRTGRTAAEYACWQQASQSRVAGSFLPFLGNGNYYLRNLVKAQHGRTLPVVNLHGEVLFRSWLDMFNGTGAPFAKSANIYSFSGKNVFIDPTWPKKAVWHGGNRYGKRSDSDPFCKEWQSNDPRDMGWGSFLNVDTRSPPAYEKLLKQDKIPCANKLIVLCIEAVTSNRSRRHSAWRQQRENIRRTRTNTHTLNRL